MRLGRGVRCTTALHGAGRYNDHIRRPANLEFAMASGGNGSNAKAFIPNGPPASVITTRQLRDSSTELDFDAPSADQLAVARRWREDGQFFRGELFVAVIAAGIIEHPRICSCSCGGIR